MRPLVAAAVASTFHSPMHFPGRDNMLMVTKKAGITDAIALLQHIKSRKDPVITVGRLILLIVVFGILQSSAEAEIPGVGFTPPSGWMTKGTEKTQYELYGLVHEVYFFPDDQYETPLISIASIEFSKTISTTSDYLEVLKNDYKNTGAITFKVSEKRAEDLSIEGVQGFRYFDFAIVFENKGITRELYAVLERPIESRLVVFRYSTPIQHFDTHLSLAKETLKSLQVFPLPEQTELIKTSGINLKLPDGWKAEVRLLDNATFEQEPELTLEFFEDLSEDDLPPMIVVASVAYTAKVSGPKQYIDAEKELLEDGYLAHKLVETQRYTEMPENGHQSQFDLYGFFDDGETTRGFWVVFDRPEEKRLVVFKYEASMEQFEIYLPVVMETFSSLQITEPKKQNRTVEAAKVVGITGSYSVSPRDMPADINHAILAIAKTIRGEISDGIISNTNTERNFSLEDAEIYRRAAVTGYRLNAILPNSSGKLGRKLIGRIFFEDDYQLRSTVEFAAEYSGNTTGDGERNLNLDKLYARLVTPEKLSFKTFLVPAGDLQSDGKPVNEIRELIDWILPYTIDPIQTDRIENGVRSYYLVTICFDRMPADEALDQRVAYTIGGKSYKQIDLIKKHYDGWRFFASIEWFDLVEGPAKYIALFHQRVGEKDPRLVHAFTPVSGGRLMVTEDQADALSDKSRVSWRPAAFTGKGTLGLTLAKDGLVKDVMIDGPADVVGIRPDDSISAINGVVFLGDPTEKLQKAKISEGWETEVVYFSKQHDDSKMVVILPDRLIQEAPGAPTAQLPD
jgi:hypothetical protein